MKLGSLASARPAYYDRNAASLALSYDQAGIAPHAVTTRVTTTVAAGRKTLVESLCLIIVRDAVATVVGNQFLLTYTQSGAIGINIQQAIQRSNTLSSTTAIATAYGITVYAGEQFRVDSADSSTGGSATYTVGVKGTTFDA